MPSAPRSNSFVSPILYLSLYVTYSTKAFLFSPVAKPPEIKIEPIPSPPISYTQTVGYLNEYTYMPRVYRKKI